MIKGAIYDLDDLMVNSHPLHDRSWEKPLGKFGKKISDIPESIRKRLIGRRVKDIADEVIRYFRIETDIDAFNAERQAAFMELVKEHLESLPGLVHSLKLLKKNGYKIAVGSSGSSEYVHFVLERFSIRGYFDAVVTGDDVKIGKPHPETYLVASKKLGLKPEECVVLEDATQGILSAKAAGCKCIAVKNINTPVQDHSKADIIVNSLEDISIGIIHKLD